MLAQQPKAVGIGEAEAKVDDRPVNFTLDGGSLLKAAAAIGTGLATGLAGAAKILTSYMKERDERYSKEMDQFRVSLVQVTGEFRSNLSEERTDRRRVTDAILQVQHDTVNALGEVKGMVVSLKEDFEREKRSLPPHVPGPT